MGYVELHCHSYYSFLDGASSPEALVARAAELGYPALALTDHNNLSGAVRFWQAARRWGIRPIIGAEVTLVNSDRGTDQAGWSWGSDRPSPKPPPDQVEERHLTLLAETQRGYANLCRLISTGQLAGQKGKPRLTVETMAKHASGLICLSGCRRGVVPTALMMGSTAEARAVAHQLRDTFGPDSFWIEIQRHALPTDDWLTASLLSLAQEVDVGTVATNNVHYAERPGQQLHDVLTCIRQHTTLPEALAGGLLHPNSERYLKSSQEMIQAMGVSIQHLVKGAIEAGSHRRAWPASPGTDHSTLLQAMRNTLRIAERCNVSLDFSANAIRSDGLGGRGALPAFSVPQGHTPSSYLRHLCEAGLQHKFSPTTEPDWSTGPDPSNPHLEGKNLQPDRKSLSAYRDQLAHELAVIERMELAGYFLVVWDIVRFACEQGIRCQGRGSAANSLVAFVLDITPVDPLRHNLLFERFLSEGPALGASEGTHTMPDIDVDFAADRREEVIQYVYNRYGEEHVGMVCNVVTYRARSALREVAKAMAFPPDVIDRAAKALDTRSAATAAEELPTLEPDRPTHPPPGSSDPLSILAPSDPSSVAPFGNSLQRVDQASLGERSLPWQTLADLLCQMDGVPRHLSIHVGGMLITAAPLVEVVPLERATMPGRVVVQWDKDSVEDAGLIKIDLLSLRTLSVIEETLDHVQKQQGIILDLDRLPLTNARWPPSRAIYDLLQRADTVGCFQVESRAQAQMLPKLQPTRFEDIVIGVALIRPGPIQGGMVHPYLRRRQGLEPVSYPHPALEPILAETKGVIIFQEQVIRVAMAIAGFTPAEADQLRRAMSRSRSQEAMMALRERFLSGARASGVDKATADEVFRQLLGFAGFGFCKSHAAAFALVAYQTLYLKAFFPAEYACALLNHQPMGFYPPEVIIGDARRHGVPILPPDVNHSMEDCTLEKPTFSEPGHSTLSALRLGLRYVHGLGEVWQARIVEGRGILQFSQQSSPRSSPRAESFQDLLDFCRRTRLPRSVVENLIRAGVLDSLEQTRRDLLWELGGLLYQEEGETRDTTDGARGAHIDNIDVPVIPAVLPSLDHAERMAWEYELLGLAPSGHVMDLYRESLQKQGVLSSRDLDVRRNGELVRLAGYAVVRQRPPTAKGYLFITLEDEDGLTNLIVRPRIYERFRGALRNAPLLWIEGQLQREGQALSVLVHRAAALNPTNTRVSA